MSVLKVKNGNQWDIVPAIKGDQGDPAADESITDAMLVPDGIKTEIDWLWGNQLMDIRDGELLTTDDAYEAPLVSLDVDGKSTQDGTPTPDAPVPIASVDAPSVTLAGKNLVSDNPEDYFHSYIYYAFDVPAIPNATYTYSRKSGSGNEIGFIMAGKDSETNPARDIVTLTYRDRWTFTNTEGFKTFRFRIHQDGVNTIKNKDLQFELGNVATSYTPYVTTTTVPLLPDGYSLRSLPDGTKDELHLSYLRPSTREGWAWYSRELVREIDKCGDGTPFYVSTIALQSDDTVSFITVHADLINHIKQHPISNIATSGGPATSKIAVASHIYMRFPQSVVGTTVASIKSYLDEHCVLLYRTATPTTETIDPIELPIMPSKDTTIWSDPATNLKMTYIQDTNLVIENLEATIADIATS